MRASCNTRNVNLCFCLIPRSSQLRFLDVFETGSTDCIERVLDDRCSFAVVFLTQVVAFASVCTCISSKRCRTRHETLYALQKWLCVSGSDSNYVVTTRHRCSSARKSE